MSTAFCTYVRFSGILWFLGWNLIGISDKPVYGGYANDYACHGNCSLALIEVKGYPTPQWFFYIPKNRILAFSRFGKIK